MLVGLHLPTRQKKKGKHFTRNVESGFGLFFTGSHVRKPIIEDVRSYRMFVLIIFFFQLKIS